jgi:lipoprotein-anchoring transpeptidase ErfK/SrfK
VVGDANPKSASAQGEENITHGCVNLSDENAEQYFNTAMSVTRWRSPTHPSR